MARRRGRPRRVDNVRLIELDDKIAQAVHALHGWAFPLHPMRGAGYPNGILECVAEGALRQLGRGAGEEGDRRQTPLSAKRIEQLYRDWINFMFRRWRSESESDSGPLGFPPTVWSRYTSDSRATTLPGFLSGMPLLELAEGLLSGSLRAELAAYYEERVELGLGSRLEPAQAWIAELQRGPMTRSLRSAFAWRRPRGRPKKNRVA